MADIAPRTVAMVAGLTDAQNAALANLQLNELVYIVPVAPPATNGQGDQESEDDAENEDEDDADEVEDQGGIPGAFPGAAGSGEGGNDSTSNGQQANISAQASDAATEPLPNPTMHVVTHITRDGDGSITGIKLAPQTYSTLIGAQYGAHNYHIHGRKCKTYHESLCGGESCTLSKSILEVTSQLNDFVVQATPNGDTIRRRIATNPTRQCTAQCNDGFLATVNDLDDMIRLYVSPLKDDHVNLPGSLMPPVCPICVGRSLLQEQQRLQHLLVSFQIPGDFFTQVTDFYARLNPRRQALHYSFRQLDEREWGFAFDDMLSEDDDGEDQDGDRFQTWAEANDPANNAPTHPVSEATIEALPRKAAFDAALEPDAECQVCKQQLEPDSTLLELPCKHFDFHEECLVMWLKQSDGCPNCRALVPDIEGKPRNQVTREAGVYPSAARQAVQGHAGSGGGHFRQRNTYQMTPDEARRYLNIDAIPLDQLDKDMLALMFEAARADHGGDRTESAIASIERALGLPLSGAAEDAEGDEEDAEGDEEDAEGEDEDAEGNEEGDTIMSDE